MFWSGSLYFYYAVMRLSEKEIAVVHDTSLLVELLHKATGGLKSLLLELLLSGLGVELDTLALLTVNNLEEEGTTITLHGMRAELSFLHSSYGT